MTIGNSPIIQSVINTEKTNKMASTMPKYGFIVHPEATKKMIITFIKDIFNFDVQNVNIINYKQRNVSFRGKSGKIAGFKKAYVTLKNKTDIINFENLKV